MIKRLFRRVWLQLLVAFDPNYTSEGFEKTGKPFSLPQGISECEPTLKRHLTICNLYANQGHSMGTIAKVLDVSHGKIVTALIEEGLIKERRRKAPKPTRGDRRQLATVLEASHLPTTTEAKFASEMNPGLNPLGLAAVGSPEAGGETSSTSQKEENAAGKKETLSISGVSLLRKETSSRG